MRIYVMSVCFEFKDKPETPCHDGIECYHKCCVRGLHAFMHGTACESEREATCTMMTFQRGSLTITSWQGLIRDNG